MKHPHWLAFGVAVMMAWPAQGKTKEIKSRYGAPVPTERTVAMTELQRDFGKYSDKTVVTEGKVLKVCQNKGCWMTLENPTGEVRVTFKNYGFFVASELIGKQVLLVGQLQRKELSESEARHYLVDDKASAEEIAKIKGPQLAWQFVANGVQAK